MQPHPYNAMLRTAEGLWEALQQLVMEQRPSLGGPMYHGQPLSLDEHRLVVGFAHPFSMEYLRDPDNFLIVRDAAQTLLGRKFQIAFRPLDNQVKTHQQSSVVFHAPETKQPDGYSEFKKTWNNLNFRSESEVRIAQALDKLNILFFPNCKGRLGVASARENREADFLVCYKGEWGILEVDGEPFHPPSRTVADHTRDRLFHHRTLFFC